MGMAGNPKPNLPRTCAREDGTPKRTFTSEAEALAAFRAKAGKRREIEVYKCRNCTFWHIASVPPRKEDPE